MTNNRKRRWIVPTVAAILAVACLGNLVAEPKKSPPPKPSAYAPSADLAKQYDYFLDRIEEDLSDAENFEEEHQQRVARDANTLAVLALVLGNHDSKNELQKSAPAILAAAESLADNADNFAAAKKSLAALKAARNVNNSKSKLEWKPVGDLQQLMMQVPIVNNSLRRGVNGRRFKRSIDKNAGHAATLAAISQASMLDTSYCSDEEEERLWAKICADMRDASAAVGKAVRQGDQEAARKGLDRLVDTCDACHHKFRD